MLMPPIHDDEWEWMWAPYDTPTYKLALDKINAGDIVLEIGAGDLRLSRLIADRARWVYALEINLALLERSASQLPANLQIIAGDARRLPFPENISTAVLLMRHCTHFALYFDKLRSGGCTRLITNARWGMGVECIHLMAPSLSYEALEFGWYACRCGHHGFKPGPPQLLTEATDRQVWELYSCPACITSQLRQLNNNLASNATQGVPW